MKRRLALLPRVLLRLLLLLPLSPIATAEQADIDAATGLVKGNGWLHVRAHCGGCHSFALVTNQRADRDTWLRMIRWMQATQNLWQFEPETERSILDYLSTHYAPADRRRRAPIPRHLMPPAGN